MVGLSHSGMIAIERCAYRLILQSTSNPGEHTNPETETHWLNTIPGHSVHLAIEEFIEQWRHNSSLTPDYESLMNYSISLINQIWEERDSRILEYIHGVEIIEDRDYHREHVAKVRDLCLMFCRIWDQIGLQEMTYVSHEKRDIAPFNDEIDLIGYIDLVVIDEDGNYLVIDWKSGLAPEKVIGYSQLAIYAFLTNHVHGVEYSNIRCGFASLATGTCRLRTFTDRDHKLLSQRVQSFIDILSLYGTGEFADSEWAAPSEQDCISCPYHIQCEFN